MSKTATIEVYRFSELSESAKEHAKNRHAEHFGYHFGNEAIESITELAEHFGGRVADYSIDWFGSVPSYMVFDMPDLDEDEIRICLEQLGSYNPETLKGNGDCKLTGYCSDEDAIDGFRKAWFEGERDLNRLMHEAYRSWLKVCQDDAKEQYSDESFSEFADANDMWFRENGRLWK